MVAVFLGLKLCIIYNTRPLRIQAVFCSFMVSGFPYNYIVMMRSGRFTHNVIIPVRVFMRFPVWCKAAAVVSSCTVL